jgi:hypothetical protein
MRGILHLTFDIMKEWIANLVSELSNSPRTDSWIIFLKEKYGELITAINDISLESWSIETRIKVSRKTHEIIELLRRIEPIVHYQENFRFTLSEFGDRVLRALGGTF